MSDSSRQWLAARELLFQTRAMQLIRYLNQAGICSLLLKGPVTARWLYVGEARIYGDIDLMVSPDDYFRAINLLLELGHRGVRPGAFGIHRVDYETTLIAADGVPVDLHRRIVGTPPQRAARAWSNLWSTSVAWRLASGDARVLNEPARAMHLALHAAQSRGDAKAMGDLRRGLLVLPPLVWVEARQIAVELGCEAAFEAGLQAARGQTIFLRGLGTRLARADARLRLSLPPRFALEALAISCLAQLPRHDRGAVVMSWWRPTELTFEGWSVVGRGSVTSVLHVVVRTIGAGLLWLWALATSW